MAPVGGGGPLVRQAKRMALADRRVRRIVGGATRVIETAAWRACNGRFLGAGVHIMLFRTLTVTEDLPFVAFGKERQDHAYAEGVLHFDADGIDWINVSVDLTRHKVVEVQPTGTDVHSRDYHIVKGPTPAGPPDKPGCETRQ